MILVCICAHTFLHSFALLKTYYLKIQTRKIFQRAPRKYANRFWLKTSASIQDTAETGDTKSVYDEVRKTVGPTKKLSSPLQNGTREILHNRNEQIGR